MITQLTLRRHDLCSVCSREQVVGVLAWWDAEERSVTCAGCHDRGAVAPEARWARRFDDHEEVEEFPPAACSGLSDEIGSDAMVLDHLRIPGSRVTTDHLVIAPSGIWLVDCESDAAKVELRTIGRRDPVTTLQVAGENRSELVEGMASQHEGLLSTLDRLGRFDVPVHLAICFTNASWPLIGGTGFVDEVWVGPVRKLAGRIREAPAMIDPYPIAAGIFEQLSPTW